MNFQLYIFILKTRSRISALLSLGKRHSKMKCQHLCLPVTCIFSKAFDFINSNQLRSSINEIFYPSFKVWKQLQKDELTTTVVCILSQQLSASELCTERLLCLWMDTGQCGNRSILKIIPKFLFPLETIQKLYLDAKFLPQNSYQYLRTTHIEVIQICII